MQKYPKKSEEKKSKRFRDWKRKIFSALHAESINIIFPIRIFDPNANEFSSNSINKKSEFSSKSEQNTEDYRLKQRRNTFSQE
uniref:Ycf1 n=1 Tax=Romanomermis culicivorax TaxID=13658 RepID=A0A915ILU8_ROMCU